jgi:1-acyl-sn-glycerol-3-phosphate acyltransferase
VAGDKTPLYKFARSIVVPIVGFWVRLDCQGMEQVTKPGPLIVAANHISYFDPVCLGTCLARTGRKVRFLAKAELFKTPVVGPVLRGAGQIPVYRESRDAAKALKDALDVLDNGGLVVVYPEGTTTKNADFSPMKAKNGVARLAALSGAPVLPVGQWGAHLLFSRGRKGPFRRGIRVVLRAGSPLHFEKDPDAPRARLKADTGQIMAAIGELVEEARLGWAPPLWYRPRPDPASG